MQLALYFYQLSGDFSGSQYHYSINSFHLSLQSNELGSISNQRLTFLSVVYKFIRICQCYVINGQLRVSTPSGIGSYKES